MSNCGYVGTRERCPGCGRLIGHDEIVLGLEDEQYSLAEYVHQPVGGDCGVVLG